MLPMLDARIVHANKSLDTPKFGRLQQVLRRFKARAFPSRPNPRMMENE